MDGPLIHLASKCLSFFSALHLSLNISPAVIIPYTSGPGTKFCELVNPLSVLRINLEIDTDFFIENFALTGGA